MTDSYLAMGGDIAAILTAISAAGASGWYICTRVRRRRKLQCYLVQERRRAESGSGTGVGARSILHLMGNLSFTEAQVLEAAFGNANIKTWVTEDEKTGRANGLMFRIDDKAWRRLAKSN